MAELLSSAQMRDIEQAEIESGAVTGLRLMERAGRGAVAAALEHWPELAQGAHRALVLCGPGNNGGDGFVIARRLRDRGWAVDVFLYGDAAKLPPDAKTNHDLWMDMGRVHPLSSEAIRACPRPDLFVDAVFGTGLTRPLPDELSDALDMRMMTHWPGLGRTRHLAVDCPSGLNLDTGTVPGGDESDRGQNRADLTVSFHSLKLGHILSEGPALCGTVRIVDIGLTGVNSAERAPLGGDPSPERVRLIDRDASTPDNWPALCIAKMQGAGHKYDHGHAMVLSGGTAQGGAARMAARAALRAGAGLVTLLCPPDALPENACQLNAIMLRPCDGSDALSASVDDRVSALCLGPGMGTAAATRDLVAAALAHETRAGRPAVVLDADALTAFADAPDALFDRTHHRTVLTPHEGEFARIFPDLSQASRGTRSKIDVVRAAADRAGCIVLLKGADTVIAQPGGGASVHSAAGPRAAPWLATAGAGDVLAGLITGLAAPAGAPALFQVVEAAVWLHVEAARIAGPGLIAEDLPDVLPQVFTALKGAETSYEVS